MRRDRAHDLCPVHARGDLRELLHARLGERREFLPQHALAPADHRLGHDVLAEPALGPQLEPLPERDGVRPDARIGAIVAVRHDKLPARTQHACGLVEESVHVEVVRDGLDRQHHVGASAAQRQVARVAAHVHHASGELREMGRVESRVRARHGLVQLYGQDALRPPAREQVRNHAEPRAGVHDDLPARAARELHELVLGAHPGAQPAVIQQVAVVAVEPRVHAFRGLREGAAGGLDERGGRANTGGNGGL